MEKLVLIDGNSLLNRAYFATPMLTTKDGKPTNAIMGFVKLLLKIISDTDTDYLIVAFDMKAPTFRHKMYDGYKATRKPMPPELAAQMQPLKDLLAAMGIAMCQKEGIEADDIVGTLSHKFNVHSYIYTGDRDSYQLVDEKTDVCFTKQGVTELFKLNKANFEIKVGIKPRQVIDLKALWGDSSDNIPGVTGIGEKTAMSLLTTYDSLDDIYNHLDDIKPAIKNKLIAEKDMAYLSYKLATIVRDFDIDINLQDCKVPKKFSNEVRRMFIELEFKNLMSNDLFSDEAPHEVKNDFKYPELIICRAQEDYEPLLKGSGDYYIDLRAGGAEIYFAEKQYSFSYNTDLLGEFSYDKFVDVIQVITSNVKNRVILFDCKKFMHDFAEFGVKLECDFEDISVLKYLVDFFDSSNNCQQLCEYYGYNYTYSAFALSRIHNIYLEKLQKEGEISLYYDIEKPLIKVLFEMEQAGVRVNRKELDNFGKIYRAKLDELSKKVFKQCECTFNLNSPSQLGEVLFEKLGLKPSKNRKNGKYSTSADVLEKLAEENEVVRDILTYRQYQKLYSGYVEGFKPLIDKTTGLVHTTYNQTITATGRLSSTNPNLQNIPVRENEGRELRKLFVPAEGNVFVDADYSQIELRLLAHFSGCKELVKAYNEGADIHAVTASQVFGVPLNEVTSNMRRDAKAVNFGIIYGISDYGLANNLNIDVKTAREYIDKYFATYSAVKEYMDSNVQFAKENGYVSTLTGRKRYIREVNSSNYNLRQFGERAAMNMPLQGSSADIIKIAMINVNKALKEKGMQSKLILQVHDELILECPRLEADAASEILKYEMENAVKLAVPLTVEISMGNNWYEAK